MSDTDQELNPAEVNRRIREALDQLEPMSPRQIKDEIAGHRRGFNQPNGFLGNWLAEKLGQSKVTVDPRQNLNNNIVVTVDVSVCKLSFEFFVGTSLQEFLGIKKKNDAISGAKLSDDQSFLLRALVDREGGSEANVVKRLLDWGIANSPMVLSFVERVRANPDWHTKMHEAGLYPTEIEHAWGEIQKAAQDPEGKK